MDDDQSRETRSVQLAATCLASWVVNGESVGGGLEVKGEFFLSFLVFPCLALPSLPALSWLGFDLEREGAGGAGLWVHCALHGSYAMQSTDGLYIGGKP